jgi:hypothetical protein
MRPVERVASTDWSGLRQEFVPVVAVPQTEVLISHHRDLGAVVFEIP